MRTQLLFGLPDPERRHRKIPGTHLRTAASGPKLDLYFAHHEREALFRRGGNPEGFDTAQWVARRIDMPLPALGGRKPVSLMSTPDGRALVHNIVARKQCSAYS